MPSKRATLDLALGIRRFAEWLATVDYKPGWHLELVDPNVQGRPAVAFRMLVWDTFALRDLKTIVTTTKYQVPAYLFVPTLDIDACRSFIRTCIHLIEKHEADEWLRFDGEQVFNPHGEPQMLGRRVEGWEWMGPACFEIAETLQQKGSHATTPAHRRVPEISGIPGPG